jgi:predicted nucleic acid-binding protein
MAFTALFDACVLYPPSLRNVLLSLAVTDLFRARWTVRIQDEWLRAALRDKPGLSEEALQRTQRRMAVAIPDAIIASYEGLISCLDLPDPDDRHVLAAAIAGRADVIVTLNLKDFPASTLAAFNIEAQHPDEFIAHVLTLAPPVALGAIKEMRARLKRPPFSPERFLELLMRQGLPQTVAILRENIVLI